MRTRRSALVSSVRSWAAEVRPRRRDLKRDLLAGMPGAIAAVPDGMANGVLAGVSPVQGLYASLVGRVAGGLTASTKMMVITTTSAAALAAGSAIEAVPDAQRSDAVVWLTLIAGAAMLVAGMVGLSRYVRFVSQSVMLGFLTGLSANILFGQLPALTGSPSQGNFALTKALNVVIHPSRMNLPSVAAGLGAVLLLAVLSRTRVASVASLVALLVPTVVVILTGVPGVATVSDLGAIPQGLPIPHLPALAALTPSVISGALAVAAIIVVQGAGVAEAAPNPDGTRSNPSRDFRAQGVANLAAGLFGGQPVGGSVGATALNRSVGARSRWAAIWSGVGVALVLVVFSTAVGYVLLPTLAAFLVYAAIKSFKPGEIWSVAHAGTNSLVALGVTLVATSAPSRGCGGRYRCRHFLDVAAQPGSRRSTGGGALPVARRSLRRAPATTTSRRRLRCRPRCLRLHVLCRGKDAAGLASPGGPRSQRLRDSPAQGTNDAGFDVSQRGFRLRRSAAAERWAVVPDWPRPRRAQGLGVRGAEQATHRRAAVSGD